MYDKYENIDHIRTCITYKNFLSNYLPTHSGNDPSVGDTYTHNIIKNIASHDKKFDRVLLQIDVNSPKIFFHADINNDFLNDLKNLLTTKLDIPKYSKVSYDEYVLDLTNHIDAKILIKFDGDTEDYVNLHLTFLYIAVLGSADVKTIHNYLQAIYQLE